MRTAIIPRIPLIDWRAGFPRHWQRAGAAASHAFNVLSLLFPQGERFFIETAREVERSLGLSPELADQLQAFVTQESPHTGQHQR